MVACTRRYSAAFLDFDSDGWLDVMTVDRGNVNSLYMRTGCPTSQGLTTYGHSSRCYRCPTFAVQIGNRCVECDKNVILGPDGTCTFSCPNGYVRLFGSDGCTACPTGTRYDLVSGDCVDCDAGLCACLAASQTRPRTQPYTGGEERACPPDVRARYALSRARTSQTLRSTVPSSASPVPSARTARIRARYPALPVTSGSTATPPAQAHVPTVRLEGIALPSARRARRKLLSNAKLAITIQTGARRVMPRALAVPWVRRTPSRAARTRPCAPIAYPGATPPPMAPTFAVCAKPGSIRAQVACQHATTVPWAISASLARVHLCPV